MSIDDISSIDIGSGLEVVGRGIEAGSVGGSSVADDHRAHSHTKPNGANYGANYGTNYATNGTNGVNGVKEAVDGNENNKENHRYARRSFL